MRDHLRVLGTARHAADHDRVDAVAEGFEPLHALIEGCCDVRDAITEGARDDQESKTRIFGRERCGRGRGLATEPVQHVVAGHVVLRVPRFRSVQSAEDLAKAGSFIIRPGSSEHRELLGRNIEVVPDPLTRRTAGADRCDCEPGRKETRCVHSSAAIAFALSTT